MSTQVPTTIRAALAESARAAESLNPDEGFGSRQPRPNEEVGKAGSWSGTCQLTGINVNWEDKYTYEWGQKREDRKSVPAVSVQLSLVTKNATGQTVSWDTKKHYWLHGDPATTLPEAPIKNWPDKYRGLAKDEMSLIMGWFKNLLGTTATDPAIRNIVDSVTIMQGLLENAKKNNSPLFVKAGWVKKLVPYPEKVNGQKTGREKFREELEDYVYENLSLNEASGQQPA